MEFFTLVLFLIVVLLLTLYYTQRKIINELKLQLQDVLSKKQSLSTRYGKMTEQFMAFIDDYPYDEHNFRFIGTPIDGIQFENDKIVFMEFKTADSQMTPKQKAIKKLIEEGKVKFEEFRIPPKD